MQEEKSIKRNSSRKKRIYYHKVLIERGEFNDEVVHLSKKGDEILIGTTRIVYDKKISSKYQ